MDRALYAMLREKAREIRELTIREIGQLSVGHIGGAVDLAELLAVLYSRVGKWFARLRKSA